MKTFDNDKTYMIEGVDLARITRVATRLFSEDRLGGNEMRNLAQALEVSVDATLELPKDPPKAPPQEKREEKRSRKGIVRWGSEPSEE